MRHQYGDEACGGLHETPFFVGPQLFFEKWVRAKVTYDA